MTTVTLTPTSGTGARGALDLGAAVYTVTTRLERIDGGFGDRLHVTIRRDGHAWSGECVAAADEHDFTVSWWCSSLLVDGFRWQIEGRRGSGVLEFSPARVPLAAKAEWVQA